MRIERNLVFLFKWNVQHWLQHREKNRTQVFMFKWNLQCWLQHRKNWHMYSCTVIIVVQGSLSCNQHYTFQENRAQMRIFNWNVQCCLHERDCMKEIAYYEYVPYPFPLCLPSSFSTSFLPLSLPHYHLSISVLCMYTELAKLKYSVHVSYIGHHKEGRAQMYLWRLSCAKVKCEVLVRANTSVNTIPSLSSLLSLLSPFFALSFLCSLPSLSLSLYVCLLHEICHTT